MTAIPTTEPAQVTAGDTIQWAKSVPDYPASQGWTLKYVLLNPVLKIQITGTANGLDHSINVLAADSAKWIAGEYQWNSYVSKATGERHSVGSGTMLIKPDFSQKEASDQRSWVKRTLDNIEAVIEQRATMDQMEYTIEGRSLKRTPIADLFVMRDKFKDLYKQEIDAQNISAGKYGKNRIYVRF